MSFVAAKIQQNCTDTGNYNSKATSQGIICDLGGQAVFWKIISTKINTCPPKLYIQSNMKCLIKGAYQSHLGRQNMGWFLADRLAWTSSKTEILNEIGI